MKNLGNFNDTIELSLNPEASDKLHFYAYHLPWKSGFFDEKLTHVKNWIVNECIRENLEVELKNAKIKPYVDPKRETKELLFDNKQKPKSKDTKIKVWDILRLFKEIEAYGKMVNPGENPKTRPYGIIEGLALVNYPHWNMVNLYNQEWENLFRYCSKSGINPDMIIGKWLEAYLNERLTDKDLKRIKSIRRAIEEAKSVREEEDRKAGLPGWDLDKV